MATATRNRPTAGQLALAKLLAEGAARAERGVSHVDADAYISADRHAAEQRRIFAHAPLVIAFLNVPSRPYR